MAETRHGGGDRTRGDTVRVAAGYTRGLVLGFVRLFFSWVILGFVLLYSADAPLCVAVCEDET